MLASLRSARAQKNRVSASQVQLQVGVECPAQQFVAAAPQLCLGCADQAAGQSVIVADQAPGQQRCEGVPQLRLQLVVLVGTAQAPVLLSAAAASQLLGGTPAQASVQM